MSSNNRRGQGDRRLVLPDGLSALDPDGHHAARDSATLPHPLASPRLASPRLASRPAYPPPCSTTALHTLCTETPTPMSDTTASPPPGSITARARNAASARRDDKRTPATWRDEDWTARAHAAAQHL